MQFSDSRDRAATEKFCVTGVWEPPNKHETTHSRRDGNEWFSPFVPTKALLADMALPVRTPQQIGPPRLLDGAGMIGRRYRYN